MKTEQNNRTQTSKSTIVFTAWEVSKYGVISGPYFPVLGLNTDTYEVKYGPEITPYLDTFHAVFDNL